MAWCANSSAVTFTQLADKNARIIELKSDLAIAKAEAELAEQKRNAQGPVFGAGGANVPAIQVNGALAAKAAAPSQKAPEPAPEKDIFLNAIHGSAANLEADFQRQGEAISRKKGEYVFDVWVISSIGYPRVTLLKRAANKKEKDVCKSVAVGASITNSPNC